MGDTNTMEESKIMEINLEGLTEQEVKGFQEIFQRFLNKYKENKERKTEEWLYEQLKEELPGREEKELRQIADEIVTSVREYDQALKSLNENSKKGITKEVWVADRLQESAKGMAVDQFTDYLYQIDMAMEQANRQMTKTILRADGGINQNINLDGFIAEQYHVNNFNTKAALEKSPYRARVCVPENGRYEKNSVDVAIDNIKTGQKDVALYQMKFCKDAKTTIQEIKLGDYKGQGFVVAEGQVEEVKAAFPDETVTDYIGGTKQIKVRSDSLSKSKAKEIQKGVQEHEKIPKADWNSYTAQKLSLEIGKQAGNAGIQAALVGAGIHLAKKAFQGEKIDTDEVVKTALETGSDACIKSAAGGALKVATEKGLLSRILPPGTPVGTLVKIACVGVEDIKILWRVAKGELTMSEAIELTGRTSVAMISGLTTATVGAGIGASVLGWIPLVGPLVGGVIGGTIGYAAGSKVGEKVFEGAKKVAKAAVKVVGRAVEVVKNVVSGIADFLFGWL